MIAGIILFTLTGCIPFQEQGKKCHLVLGIGIFQTETTNEVHIVRVSQFGAYVGDGRFSLGFSELYSASVPTNANVVLEISHIVTK